MLGVAVDDLPNPSSSSLNRSYGAQSSHSATLAAGAQHAPPTGTAGLEGWNGWAAPHGAAADSGAGGGSTYGAGAAGTYGVPLNRTESGVSPFASTSSAPRASLQVCRTTFPPRALFSLKAEVPSETRRRAHAERAPPYSNRRERLPSCRCRQTRICADPEAQATSGTVVSPEAERNEASLAVYSSAGTAKATKETVSWSEGSLPARYS